MERKHASAGQIVLTLLLAAALCSSLVGCRKGPTSLRGAVLEQNSDPKRESPLTGVGVTAVIGSTQVATRTDAAGFFKIDLRQWIRPGQPLRFTFQRTGYRPLVIKDVVSDKLYVVHMMPMVQKPQPETKQPQVSISNVKVRYSTKTTAAANVGSVAKVFEVVNTGNLPCNGQPPCSPDGKWKASLGTVQMDAGEGNEFRNIRLSCIAGPCPFTTIESGGYFKTGSKIEASILGWSDTTTFLVEAEVYHPMVSEIIQESYPVIFGRRLNFSVPDTAEGVSIEADENGGAIVYPLGPSLCLTWADCSSTTDRDHSKNYRCELKPGFEFR